MMDLSKLITENRKGLYCGRYEFKLSFMIPEIGRVRYCMDYKAFKARIEFLRHKGWISQDFVLNKKLQIIFQNYFKWKPTTKNAGISIRLNRQRLSICANDITLLQHYATFFEGVPTVFRRAINNTPQGVLYFKRTPPTKYRVYFKYTKVDDTFYKTLAELFNRYKNTTSPLYPSKSLTRWIDSTTIYQGWISGNYSIGYNNESDYTIIALTIPEVLGPKFKLEKIVDQ